MTANATLSEVETLCARLGDVTVGGHQGSAWIFSSPYGPPFRIVDAPIAVIEQHLRDMMGGDG